MPTGQRSPESTSQSSTQTVKAMDWIGSSNIMVSLTQRTPRGGGIASIAYLSMGSALVQVKTKLIPGEWAATLWSHRPWATQCTANKPLASAVWKTCLPFHRIRHTKHLNVQQRWWGRAIYSGEAD